MNEEILPSLEPPAFLGSAKLSRSQQWDLLREDVQNFYMIKNNTLPTTMSEFAERLGFHAWLFLSLSTRVIYTKLCHFFIANALGNRNLKNGVL